MQIMHAWFICKRKLGVFALLCNSDVAHTQIGRVREKTQVKISPQKLQSKRSLILAFGVPQCCIPYSAMLLGSIINQSSSMRRYGSISSRSQRDKIKTMGSFPVLIKMKILNNTPQAQL